MPASINEAAVRGERRWRQRNHQRSRGRRQGPPAATTRATASAVTPGPSNSSHQRDGAHRAGAWPGSRAARRCPRSHAWANSCWWRWGSCSRSAKASGFPAANNRAGSRGRPIRSAWRNRQGQRRSRCRSGSSSSKAPQDCSAPRPARQGSRYNSRSRSIRRRVANAGGARAGGSPGRQAQGQRARVVIHCSRLSGARANPSRAA